MRFINFKILINITNLQNYFVMYQKKGKYLSKLPFIISSIFEIHPNFQIYTHPVGLLFLPYPSQQKRHVSFLA